MNISALFCAVVVFFVAGAMSSFVGGGSILIAFIAAAWAYSKIDETMKNELYSKLNPAPQTWNMPMPQAWIIVKECLEGAQMVTGASGITRWHIIQEDSTRGILEAEIACTQVLGGLTSQTLVKRTVGMSVQMTPSVDGQTIVQINFQFFSPSGTGLVEMLVGKTISDIKLRADVAQSQLSVAS